MFCYTEKYFNRKKVQALVFFNLQNKQCNFPPFWRSRAWLSRAVTTNDISPHVRQNHIIFMKFAKQCGNTVQILRNRYKNTRKANLSEFIPRQPPSCDYVIVNKSSSLIGCKFTDNRLTTRLQ